MLRGTAIWVIFVSSCTCIFYLFPDGLISEEDEINFMNISGIVLNNGITEPLKKYTIRVTIFSLP